MTERFSERFLPAMFVAEPSNGHNTTDMRLYRASMDFLNLDSIRDGMFTNAPHLPMKQLGYIYRAR
jgi:hypothetical protein